MANIEEYSTHQTFNEYINKHPRIIYLKKQTNIFSKLEHHQNKTKQNHILNTLTLKNVNKGMITWFLHSLPMGLSFFNLGTFKTNLNINISWYMNLSLSKMLLLYKWQYYTQYKCCGSFGWLLLSSAFPCET